MLRTTLGFGAKITDYDINERGGLERFNLNKFFLNSPKKNAPNRIYLKHESVLWEGEPNAGNINCGDIFVIKDPNPQRPVQNLFEARRFLKAILIAHQEISDLNSEPEENYGAEILSVELDGTNPRTDEYIPNGRDFDIYPLKEFLNLATAMSKSVIKLDNDMKAMADK